MSTASHQGRSKPLSRRHRSTRTSTLLRLWRRQPPHVTMHLRSCSSRNSSGHRRLYLPRLAWLRFQGPREHGGASTTAARLYLVAFRASLATQPIRLLCLSTPKHGFGLRVQLRRLQRCWLRRGRRLLPGRQLAFLLPSFSQVRHPSDHLPLLPFTPHILEYKPSGPILGSPSREPSSRKPSVKRLFFHAALWQMFRKQITRFRLI